MKVKINFTIDVDAKKWADRYFGDTAKITEVRKDIQIWARGLIRETLADEGFLPFEFEESTK